MRVKDRDGGGVCRRGNREGTGRGKRSFWTTGTDCALKSTHVMSHQPVDSQGRGGALSKTPFDVIKSVPNEDKTKAISGFKTTLAENEAPSEILLFPKHFEC